MTRSRKTQAAADQVAREGHLAAHVRAAPGPFNAESLSRSYAVPVDRARQIITRNGGSHA